MEAQSVKRKPGRPAGSKTKNTGCKIKPEVIDIICRAIEVGHTYKAACALAGITQTTFNNWKRRGATAKKGLYREFAERVEIAEGRMMQKVEAAMIQLAFGKMDTKIKGSKEDPESGKTLAFEKTLDAQMLRFLAERHYPDIWGNRQHISIGGTGQPLSIKLVDPTFIPGSAELDYDPDDPDEMSE